MNFKEFFKLTYIGSIRGDECSHEIYEPLKTITVQQFCDYIIENHTGEWGYIGINHPGEIFGKPNVEYFHGEYVDSNRKPIKFKFPPEIANKTIKQLDWDGGWSRSDWILTI